MKEREKVCVCVCVCEREARKLAGKREDDDKMISKNKRSSNEGKFLERKKRKKLILKNRLEIEIYKLSELYITLMIKV